MIENATKQKVADVLKMFPRLSDSIRDSLPNKKQLIWHTIKSHFQRLIDFAYDEQYQLQVYSIFKEIDLILGICEADKFQIKTSHQIHKFPQTLQTIMQQYQQLEKHEQNNMSDFHRREDLMCSTFSKTFPYWSFTQVIEFIEKTIGKLEVIGVSDMTQHQQTLYPVIKSFKSFYENSHFDIGYLDEILLRKANLNSNSSFDKSQESKMGSGSGLNLKSSSGHGESKIIDCLERVRLGSENTFVEKQKSRSDEIMKKNIQKDKIDEERRSDKEVFAQQFYPSLKNQRRKCIEVIDLTLEQIEAEVNLNIKYRNSLNYSKLLTSFQRFPSLSLSSIACKKEESSEEMKFEISKTFLAEWENQKLYQEYSSQMIHRYSKQSRFTEDDYYKDLRQQEVSEISQKQLKPLVNFLKSLPQCEVNNQSLFNTKPNHQVQIYGSFENRCGFRKISDVNINIAIQKLQHQSIPASVQLLRNKLDLYRRKGDLNFLNLKSVISSDHNEVILSHHYNTFKPRTMCGNIVNYIYIAINNKSYVESSKFMKEVVYNGDPQKEQIRHLVNFIHLVFKRNCILDNKDISHGWRAQNQQYRQNKLNRLKNHVGISVYALHMMVLFYLQQTGQISKISWREESKRYQFKVIQAKMTLYERYINFVKFYSMDGQFNRLEKTSNTNIIDIVERTEQQTVELQKWLSSYRNASKIGSYKFVFIHPMAGRSIRIEDSFSFQLSQGNQKEQLLYQKLSELLKRDLEVFTHKRETNQWQLEHLFDSNNYKRGQNMNMILQAKEGISREQGKTSMQEQIE